MAQMIANVTIVVRDYDEAIAYYTGALGFRLVEDTPLSPEKRFVLVAPQGEGSTRLLLAKAANAEQASRIGNQTGGVYSCSSTPRTSGMIIARCASAG